MGFGVGYNSCLQSLKGYQVAAFDGSDSGVKRSRELAIQNDLDPDMFALSDHSYLKRRVSIGNIRFKRTAR